MNSPIIQLLVLAGIAVFLILKLRNVLGTREGFEKPPEPQQVEQRARNGKPDFAVIEGGPDRDITDHVPEGNPSARALAEMKRIEPGFKVGEFLSGARGAYEMILMAFERGDLASVSGFLAPDVLEAFSGAVAEREAKGWKVDATFVGISNLSLKEADFDQVSREAHLSVAFTGELTSVVRDRAGDVVEGDPSKIRQEKDVWTFARTMGSDDPNWRLVATGE